MVGQFIGCLIFGGFIALYVSTLFMAPNLTTFNCIRTQSSHFSCESISSGILGEYKTKFPLGQIESAEVSNLYADSYKVALNTKAGKIYIETFKSSGSGYEIQEKVAAINSFIKDDTQKSLMIKKDDRWQLALIPFFLLFWIGVLVKNQQ
jgi:hypothetical protein